MRIGADVGGTFTDVVVHHTDGSATVHKALSTPPRYENAVLEEVRAILDDHTVANDDVAAVVHGTTVATNTVLEHRGSITALVTTKGFRDVLELRRLRMPHMYDLFWQKPPPIVPRELRFEVNERMAANGKIRRPLHEEEVVALAGRLLDAGVEAVALCFLHSHRHPAHEMRAAALLREHAPGLSVTASVELLREEGEYERSATTAINAYVRPVMELYVDRLDSGIKDLGISAPLTIMRSSGGVMTAPDSASRPVFLLESGPAAGVVAAAGLAEHLGLGNIIAFDMGGTTAKASLIENGEISRSREYEVGASLSSGSRLIRGSGELIRIPTLDIAEVGAGGGSVAWLDVGDGLHVGPRSSGASPGPACYGRGGDEPTVTDANVVLGYMRTGPIGDGRIAIDRDLAASAFDGISERLERETVDTATGVHQLANARMMRALRAVSSERGRQPADFALIAYGGAGPIHAAGLATDLDIRRVIIPPNAGVFSATGLLLAKREFHDVRACRLPCNGPETPRLVSGLLGEMVEAVEDQLPGDVSFAQVPSFDMRYSGQSWDLELTLPMAIGDWTSLDSNSLQMLVEEFEDEHERVYGVRYDAGAGVEIRAVRLAVVNEDDGGSVLPNALDDIAAVSSTRDAWFGGEVYRVPIRARADIPVDGVEGPLFVDEYDTTVVVPPGWQASREPDLGCLILERSL